MKVGRIKDPWFLFGTAPPTFILPLKPFGELQGAAEELCAAPLGAKATIVRFGGAVRLSELRFPLQVLARTRLAEADEARSVLAAGTLAHYNAT